MPARVSIVSLSSSNAFSRTLQGLGFGVQVEGPDKVRSLTPQTVDFVYLVPFDLLETEHWPELRVELARSSRYYVVFGKKLDSARIVTAMRDGAHEVIDEGDPEDRIVGAVGKAEQAQRLWLQLYGGGEEVSDGQIAGRSSAIRAVRDSIQRIGPTSAAVLILGESGTGKELVADAMHRAYGKGKLVAVNCAAIPSELLESELFGVEKGAFTGAHRSKPGLAEEADGGTLFLDEIGELDLALQPKLLRFLENGVARRVGGTADYRVQVRLVSATNRDLHGEAERGRFRLDLYYRLSEVILNVPPLRHRKEDISDLVPIFLRGAAERMGKNFESVEPELIYRFQLHSWPGNVRELKQVVERLAIHYDGPVMRAEWWSQPSDEESELGGLGMPYAIAGGAFPGNALRTHTGRTRTPYPGMTRMPFAGGHAQASGGRERPPFRANAEEGLYPGPVGGGRMNRKEKQNLARRLMEESDGDLTWVAAQMGIHPTTLYRWRKSGKV